jgi:hypothetical protein
MNKALPSSNPKGFTAMPNSAVGSGRKLVRHSALTLLLATLVLAPSGTPRAQRSKNPPVNVAGVSTRQAGGKTVVTVSADSNLNRTQTWQDDEGFHLVLPQAGRSNLKTVPRGVKVRKLDTALELVVPVKPGSNVTVEPHYNHLNLVVNGGIDTTRRETEEFEAPARKSERAERRAEQYTEAPAVCRAKDATPF